MEEDIHIGIPEGKDITDKFDTMEVNELGMPIFNNFLNKFNDDIEKTDEDKELEDKADD